MSDQKTSQAITPVAKTPLKERGNLFEVANKQVAKEMGISPRTAEVHRRNILHKTRAGNLLELDALARRAQKAAKA